MSKLIEKLEAIVAQNGLPPPKDQNYIHVWVSDETAATDRFVYEYALPKLLAVARAAESLVNITVTQEGTRREKERALEAALTALDEGAG